MYIFVCFFKYFVSFIILMILREICQSIVKFVFLGFDEDGFPILQNPMALKLPDDRNSFVLLGYDKNKLAVTLPEKEYFHEMAELYCTYPDAIHKQCEQTLKKIIDRLNEYQKQLLQTELC